MKYEHSAILAISHVRLIMALEPIVAHGNSRVRFVIDRLFESSDVIVAMKLSLHYYILEYINLCVNTTALAPRSKLL